jgi:outer membrane murein-binding lipoprotein Lpp
MKRTLALSAAAIAAAVVCGCQSQQQMVDEMQADATHVAQRRGAFELNCPAATASVLSKEMIQTPVTNPRWAPPERAEYTVGVSGCDKRATYLVVCAAGGTGCVAGGARNEIQTGK